MTAIALALGASMLWGVGDFLGGVNSRRLPMLTVLAVSELAGLVAVAVFVAAAGGPAPSAGAAAAAAVAGLGGVVGLGALYRGMAVGALGVVAPISSAAAAIPVAVGLARGERPSLVQLVGVAVALVGIALVSREPGPGKSRAAAGAGLALLAAAGFGAYFVFIDVASDGGVAWAVMLSRGVATVVAFSAAAARRSARPGVAALPPLVVIGLFDVGANALLALALTKGFVSLVSVLASLYPLVTVALAYRVLHERVARTQQAGVVAALAGAGLISAG